MKNIELLPGFFAQIKKEYGNDRIRNGNFVHAVMADLLPNAIELRRCIKLIYESKAMEYILEIAKEPSLANVQRQKALECLVDFAFMDRQIATVIIDGVLVALYPSVSTAAPPDEVDVPKAKEVQSTEFDILEACFKASEEDIQIKKEEFYGKGQQFYAQQQYIEAVKWYRKAANLGHADAQNGLGVCYHNGNGVTKDLIEAVKWFRKAADQGLAFAQYSLGYCYQNGQGVEKDLTVAEQWYSKAAAQGEENAKKALAELQAAKAAEDPQKLCETGDFFYDQKDYDQAVKCFRKAAEQELAYAQYSLGYCYEYGKGVIKDPGEAVKWYRKATDQGDADAQYRLGRCYQNGLGVAKDLTAAEQWYSKAAAQGEENAKKALQELQAAKTADVALVDPQKLSETVKALKKQGHYTQAHELVCKAVALEVDPQKLYEMGTFFNTSWNRDRDIAFEFFYKAANLGHADAQCELGKCHSCDNGDRRDLAEAVTWYRKAAAQGNDNAKKLLATLEGDPYKLCETGRSFDKREDYVEAVAYFRKAADKGYAEAQYNLGHCYFMGQGVSQDYAEAVKWFQKAAKQGDYCAQHSLSLCYENGLGVAKDLAKARKWDQKTWKNEEKNDPWRRG